MDTELDSEFLAENKITRIHDFQVIFHLLDNFVLPNITLGSYDSVLLRLWSHADNKSVRCDKNVVSERVSVLIYGNGISEKSCW